MGLFAKLFGWKIRCPDCGARNAKDSFAGVHCRNPQCRNYDPQYAETSSQYTQRNPRTGGLSDLPETVHFKNPLKIEYVNSQNERKEFCCERASVLQRGPRISVRVEPTGRRISLAPERIRNMAEVQAVLDDQKPDFTDSVEIIYENFLGKRKTFHGARRTVRFVGNHVSVCVAPLGKRISLNRNQILNWPTVEQKLG